MTAMAVMSPATLAFDIDGVVANTMQLFLDIVQTDYGISGIRYSDITSYNLEDCLKLEPALIETIIGRLLNGDYTCKLQPLPGAPRVLANLACWHQPLLFVTARPFYGPIVTWLHELLPVAPEHIQVVATGSFEAKAQVLAEHDIQFFVEDRLETCFTLAEAGVTPIVFRQPWNRSQHPFMEVGGWSELARLIEYPDQPA